MPALAEEVCRSLVAAARRADLATIGSDGHPRIVPCVFALIDAGTVVTPVDDKPKRTRRLARLEDIAADPRVALLVDSWDEDWSRLWWVQMTGRARLLRGDEDLLAPARQRLLEKYRQYDAAARLDPVIAVDVKRWRGWAATSATHGGQPVGP